eukprot:COSAG02_NODE_1793_length_10918_cov_41.286533_4_plen_75_part_00
MREELGGLQSWRDCVGVAANRGRSCARVREDERREERCSHERPPWVAARGARSRRQAVPIKCAWPDQVVADPAR